MSRNKSVFNSNKCEHIQNYLIEYQNTDIQLNLPLELSEHLNSCQNCREFVHHISIIRDSVATSLSQSIRPRAHILRELMTDLNKKPLTGSSLTYRIQSILNYPIPAYQVLTGLLLILALTVGSGMFSDSVGMNKSSANTFYLADSTQKLFLSRGKTVHEDTLWSRYMVTF